MITIKRARFNKVLFLQPARHFGFREGRHVLLAGERRLHDADGERRTGAFAESQAEIEQRFLAEPSQHLRMGAFR